jgi:catechol 1,2-dioxygenase
MSNPRVEAIFTDIVGSLRRIIEDHRVTWDEYRAATEWLTEAGSQGYEIPLLLDVFLSPTVDDNNFPANGGTESNVEGPFYVADAPLLTRPHVLPQREDEAGDVLRFSGRVLSLDGSPLPEAMLDVWQASSRGEYSHFHPGVPDHNLRGKIETDEDGRYEFRTIVPPPYEIPKAGATGRLLDALGRHAFRPGHIHFKVSCGGFRALTTQIYFEGDPWLDSDVVGAVKTSLVISLEKHEDEDEPGTGVQGQPYFAGSYDFVLSPA